MRKILFLLLAFTFVANAETREFSNIRKCSKTEDRLICSQKSYDAKGFVYFPAKQKLYVMRSSTQSVIYSIHKASGYETFEGERGNITYLFSDIDDIESLYCYNDKTIYRYLDKYGFEKKETFKGKGREFCEEKFNKLLP